MRPVGNMLDMLVEVDVDVDVDVDCTGDDSELHRTVTSPAMNGDGVALLVVVNVGMAAADVMALLGHSHSNDGRVGDDCGDNESRGSRANDSS